MVNVIDHNVISVIKARQKRTV